LIVASSLFLLCNVAQHETWNSYLSWLRAKTPFFGKGPKPFSLGKYAWFRHTLGKGVSNLTSSSK
jgi:hypothetical protein